MVSQIRAAGLNQPIVGQEGYDSQKFIEIAGKASEGVLITTSLDRDSSSPETQAFISGFAKKAGYPADMVAASGHTALLVVADALKRAGSNDASAYVMPFQKLVFRRPQAKFLSTHWVRFKKMSKSKL